MLLKSVQFKYIHTTLVVLLLSVAVSVFGKNQGSQIKTLFSGLEVSRTSTSIQNSTGKSTPNSSVTIDFSTNTAESWDEKHQAANLIAHCINGDSITGVEYSNITIETVGNSFFSEAIIYFSDSNGIDGLNLAIGTGNETSGTALFSSNGISDISDSGNLDVFSLSDKKIIMQFYEKIDDEQNQIDARFTNGILKVWGVNLTPAENCPFISSTNSGGADLAVSYDLASTGPFVVGDDLVFDIEVSNTGADIALNVTLENTLSPFLEFSQLSCDDGTSVSSPASIASVAVNNIAISGTLACTLEATIISVGSIQSSVTVSTSSFDLNLANNSAPIVIAGAVSIVPIDPLTLLIMAMAMLFFAFRLRKFN